MTLSTGIRLIAVILVCATVGHAQQEPTIGLPVSPLGAGPFVFDTAETPKIRVSVVTGACRTRGVSPFCPMAACWSPSGEAASA